MLESLPSDDCNDVELKINKIDMIDIKSPKFFDDLRNGQQLEPR